jgi:cysteine desulfurase
MIMDYIYLDNAATTKVDKRVLEAMRPFLNERYGNPSSIHKPGREAKVFLEEAREAVADFIGAAPSEIYFTSGGTESNNFAIKGIAFGQLGKKNNIISSRIEHSAVLDTLNYLQDKFGFEITYVPTDKHGIMDHDILKKSINERTFLICVMHSNNELGVINDINAISQIANERNIFFHTDSVQSIGKTHFNVNELNCTTATLSAHKIYGPKGIGALYIRKGTSIDKFIHGGKQERDRRGGTENMPAIAGFKQAIEILNERMDKDIIHYKKLKTYLLTKLRQTFADKVIINSVEGPNSLPNIVNFSFDLSKVKIDPDTLLINLDLKGIAVSSGSACTSGSIQPSHVLKAIGYADDIAKSSLRISFGRENTEKEIDYLVSFLEEITGKEK